MVADPYKVLGISPGATQDEIKRAYRQRAKENHPDLHPGDKEAEKRMHEINEAYDMLMNPDKYARQRAQEQSYGNPFGGYSAYGQRSGQGSYGGWGSDFFGFDDFFGFGGFHSQVPPPQVEAGDSPLIQQVIADIRQQQFMSAISRLQSISDASRDARWYYLSGVANHGLGNQVTAVEHMRRAVQLNPNNRIYQLLLQQYTQAGQTYEQHSQDYRRSALDPSRLCTGMCQNPCLSFCLLNTMCRFCPFYWCC